MEGKDHLKYQSLKSILSAPSDPSAAAEPLRNALRDAVGALDISAASIALVSKENKPILAIREGEKELSELLEKLETRMIQSLRSEFGIETFYSTLNHQGEKSLFSYLLKAGDKYLGAVSGICRGKRNIALEEEFIAVIGSALTLLFGQSGLVDAARLEAVRQTTITLNHEINNPLTVVIGNAQLLLMEGGRLPEAVRKRLELIEQSSLRIRDVVTKLLELTEAKSTTYVEDIKMIDIQDSEGSDK